MVGGPAHGPRVDVVQLAACARARTLVTLAILKQLLFAMSHRCRDGAVVLPRAVNPFFVQGSKPIVIAMIVTTMQKMSHPLGLLRPPPNIAPECIC